MTKEELVTIDEVGEVIAQSILDFFAVEGNRDIVQRLRQCGVQMELDPASIQAVGDKLKGLTFVVSGVFRNFSRESIKASIEQNGGKTSGSISSKTSFVLAGADMGPAKRSKAEALKVQVIDEDAYMRMINE
jgi:DNA ligase (NAD+)